jgi:predicted DNA-binding transcriptional regulator YafY
VEGRWYLLGFDVNRADWRVFRIDRIERPATTCHRFAPRDIPGGDPAAYLARADERQYRHTARLSADSAVVVTQYVAAVGALTSHFELEAPDEVRRRLRTLGARLGSV